MNMDIMRVTGLYKTYDQFSLKNINFNIESGKIVGLIGENGAGKTTIIRQILGISDHEKGSIFIWGKNLYESEKEIKENIGVVFDDCFWPDIFNAKDIDFFMRGIYKKWNTKIFYEYLEKFSIPLTKEIRYFSKGMKAKLSIATALSHNAELLILDEATSGLDPVIRDEVLDILLEFVQDKKHSILVSSHIISDLEKVADYIIFVHSGEIVFSEEKDKILDEWGLFEVGEMQFNMLDLDDILTYQLVDGKYKILTKNIKEIKKKYNFVRFMKIDLEELMLMFIKGVTI